MKQGEKIIHFYLYSFITCHVITLHFMQENSELAYFRPKYMGPSPWLCLMPRALTPPHPTPTLGWSDFLIQKLETYHVVPNCFRTSIPKMSLLIMLFNLLQGLNNFDCYPNISTQKIISNLC